MAHLTRVRRGSAVSSTTNSTSWTTPTISFAGTNGLNTAIADGERVRWLLLISADGNPTITENSGTGWNRIDQASNSTVVTGALFWLETTTAFAAGAHPSFSVASTASEQFSATLFAYRAAAGQAIAALTAAPNNGSSTNSDPAQITNDSGASRDLSVVAFRAGDSTVVATVAPTNYGNLISQAGGGTNGASSNGADRQVTVASAGTENPGTFTSASEQWVTWTHGIYEIPGTQDLTPSLFTNSASFFSPTVAADAVGLAPSLFTNSQTFHDPAVASTYAVTAGLFTNSNQFFDPTVEQAAANLTPDLYTNAQTFHAPTVAAGAVDLAPSLYTPGNSFFSATVAATYGLAPDLFTNAASFHSATVAPGALDLAPALYSNSAIFYSATVAAGALDLLPGLFTPGNSFFAATVSATAQIVPDLFTNQSVFPSAAVTSTVGLVPNLFANDNSFPSATVGAGAVNLIPSLLSNAQTFFAPLVSAEGGPQPVAPDLYTNTSQFFSATVQPGAIALLAPLVSNDNQFYSPQAQASYSLTPALYANDNQFFGPTVSTGGNVDLQPALFVNTSIFYTPSVAGPLEPSEDRQSNVLAQAREGAVGAVRRSTTERAPSRISVAGR